MYAIQDYPNTIKVSALHALAYCPRLFYFEEVEELYVQNAAVFAGRRLHAELERNEEEEWEDLFLESGSLGLRGRVDALRSRDGQLIPYEHKRGRCWRDDQKQPQAWESDRLQLLAYCTLIESTLGIRVQEGRIRYHADNVVVHVPFDAAGEAAVQAAITRAFELRAQRQRPPVTVDANRCTRCSLAPVCLPEEARLSHNARLPVRLFPNDTDQQVVHILEPGTRVGRTGEQLKITRRDQPVERVPIAQVHQVVLHSFSQISTQAIHLCQHHDVGIHWLSGGGRYVGSLDMRQGSVQRRIWQYQQLADPGQCLTLARLLVACRGQSQRQFLLRSRRQQAVVTADLPAAIRQMQAVLKTVPQADSLESLLGLEGQLAALYFGVFGQLLKPGIPPELGFSHRNRRPPRDRVNALLGFGYALLLTDVMNAILTVGLEPALGFYHQPRSQAAPLALDMMEIFRVPLVDMPVVASINRGQWDVETDFAVTPHKVWLSEAGRRKFIGLYEQRKGQQWKHPVTKYSLTYRRLLELEVRLLEKQWLGEGEVFGRLVLR
ncbi:MAG: type I-MYXAN CRISPR-associated endonuclease Cas1 [Cyanobacteria bacterium P01_G01_bin.54]